jgi:hypothetical protein
MASPACAVAVIAEPTFGTAGPRCGRWSQAWPVTAESNTSVLPNRDIVPAVGCKPGDILTARVRRNGNVERTAKGPKLELGKAPRIGYGLEVDQGPAGWDKPCPGTRRTVVPRGSGTSRNTTFAPSAVQAFRGAPTSQQGSHRSQPDSTRVTRRSSPRMPGSAPTRPPPSGTGRHVTGVARQLIYVSH